MTSPSSPSHFIMPTHLSSHLLFACIKDMEWDGGVGVGGGMGGGVWGWDGMGVGCGWEVGWVRQLLLFFPLSSIALL